MCKTLGWSPKGNASTATRLQAVRVVQLIGPCAAPTLQSMRGLVEMVIVVLQVEMV